MNPFQAEIGVKIVDTEGFNISLKHSLWTNHNFQNCSWIWKSDRDKAKTKIITRVLKPSNRENKIIICSNRSNNEL